KDICDAGRHLLFVINQVLDLAKIEAGKAELDEDVVPLDAIVNLSIAQVRAVAKSKDVGLEVQVDQPSPSLRVDEHKICQVLINVLGNAVKFTQAGGHVSLRAARMADGAVEIAIRDDGVGMDNKEMAIALQPFGQVENLLTKMHEGTGLGLPLAR